MVGVITSLVYIGGNILYSILSVFPQDYRYPLLLLSRFTVGFCAGDFKLSTRALYYSHVNYKYLFKHKCINYVIFYIVQKIGLGFRFYHSYFIVPYHKNICKLYFVSAAKALIFLIYVVTLKHLAFVAWDNITTFYRDNFLQCNILQREGQRHICTLV